MARRGQSSTQWAGASPLHLCYFSTSSLLLYDARFDSRLQQVLQATISCLFPVNVLNAVRHNNGCWTRPGVCGLVQVDKKRKTQVDSWRTSCDSLRLGLMLATDVASGVQEAQGACRRQNAMMAPRPSGVPPA